MRIRNLVIDPPVFMAPMAGITDSPYRRVLKACGCPVVVTEMISSEGLVRKGQGSLDLLRFEPEEQPIIAQIFGYRPEAMAEAALMCQDHGFAGVDINMGCPMKKVVRHGAGAALMRYPKNASDIVAAVRRVTELPLTAKIRAGWSPSRANALEVARGLADAGVDAVAVHARFRSQYYAGQADWSLIARIVDALPIPVIGNGDLVQPEDGPRMQRETGCQALMVGRAAMGNPWLPLALAQGPYPPKPQEKIKAFCTHLSFMIAWLGSEQRAVPRMRKHLIWYSRGLRGVTELRRQLSQFEKAEDLISAYTRLVEDQERIKERSATS